MQQQFWVFSSPVLFKFSLSVIASCLCDLPVHDNIWASPLTMFWQCSPTSKILCLFLLSPPLKAVLHYSIPGCPFGHLVDLVNFVTSVALTLGTQDLLGKKKKGGAFSSSFHPGWYLVMQPHKKMQDDKELSFPDNMKMIIFFFYIFFATSVCNVLNRTKLRTPSPRTSSLLDIYWSHLNSLWRF